MSDKNNVNQIKGPIVALIAAAVSLALQKPHRIVSIEGSSSKENSFQVDAPIFVLNPWSMEGRFQHFGSHKVR